MAVITVMLRITSSLRIPKGPPSRKFLGWLFSAHQSPAGLPHRFKLRPLHELVYTGPQKSLLEKHTLDYLKQKW